MSLNSWGIGNRIFEKRWSMWLFFKPGQKPEAQKKDSLATEERLMMMPSPMTESFEHYSLVMETIHNNYTPHRTSGG